MNPLDPNRWNDLEYEPCRCRWCDYPESLPVTLMELVDDTLESSGPFGNSDSVHAIALELKKRLLKEKEVQS